MFICVLLALLGLTGGEGPLSTRESKLNNQKIKYDKFLRYKHTYELMVISNTPEDTLTIEMDNNYFKKLGIDRIIPEPVEQSLINNNIKFSFLTGSKNQVVRFLLKPKKAGSTCCFISINNTEFKFNQFIFP